MKILIIGYKTTGKAVGDYLDKKKIDYDIYDKEYVSSKRYVSLNTLKKRGRIYDFGIISPGIKKDDDYIFLKSICIELYSELDFAFLQLKNPYIIGITGSNGKTSFATFLSKLLSKKTKTHLLGNIGVPFITVCDNYNEGEIIVLELSSYQLSETRKLKLNYLFLTSLTPNHLDVYIDKYHYYFDKLRAKKLLINEDNIYLIDKIDKDLNIKINKLVIKKDFLSHINKNIIDNMIKKYINIAANFALNLNVKYEDIIDVIKILEPVKYRNNYLGKYNNFHFINDGKSTTVDATLSCYKSFKDRENVLLIIGGIHKSNDFSILKLAKNHQCLIYGRDKEIIYKQINGIIFNTLEEIFKYLITLKDETYVLFSPGCSSFDQYKSYIRRSEHFELLIKKYFIESDLNG